MLARTGSCRLPVPHFCFVAPEGVRLLPFAMFRNKKTTQVNPKLLASIQVRRSPRPRAHHLKRELFKEKAVLTWSVEDVGAWLR